MGTARRTLQPLPSALPGLLPLKLQHLLFLSFPCLEMHLRQLTSRHSTSPSGIWWRGMKVWEKNGDAAAQPSSQHGMFTVKTHPKNKPMPEDSGSVAASCITGFSSITLLRGLKHRKVKPLCKSTGQPAPSVISFTAAPLCSPTPKNDHAACSAGTWRCCSGAESCMR